MRILRKRLASLVIVTMILLQLSPTPLPVSVRGEDPNVTLWEDVSYKCNRTIQHGYAESMSSHVVRLYCYDMSPGSHNVTLVLESTNSIVKINSQYGGSITNRSSNGQTVVTVITPAAAADIQITLNNSVEPSLDPFCLFIEPWDASTFSLDESGQLKFTLKLNSTEFVSEASLRMSEPFSQATIGGCSFEGDLNMTAYGSGDSISFRIVDIQPGPHSEHFSLSENGGSGNLYVSLSKYARDSLSFPVTCIIDDSEVETRKTQSVGYWAPMIVFSSSVVPWVYGYSDSSLWVVNFQASTDLTLTIDSNSREMVDALIIGSTINDFNVQETQMYDNPCYQLRLSLSNPSSVTLGLMVRHKIWFLRPTLIDDQEIPSDILKQYGVPNGYYSPCMDVNSSKAQAWARQVVGDEKNPYFIAYRLYDNLSQMTDPPHYNLTYWGEGNPPASDVLNANVTGVCRHFAYTYATLCIASGLAIRTVTGTAAGSSMWKLNHAWTEVYLPGYGWVSADVTFHFFGELRSSHIQYTLWPTDSESFGNELNQTSAASRDTLTALVDICLAKIRHILDRGLNATSPQRDRLLQAQEFAIWSKIAIESGDTYQALVLLCKSMVIIAQVEGSAPLTFILLVSPILILVVSTVLWQFLKTRKKFERMGPTHSR